MDFNMISKNRGRKKNSINEKKRSDSLMKVVYISSPMKVKTSAAKFRTIVQKLTGRDSDISDYMLDDGGARVNPTPDFEILPEAFNIGSDQSNYPQHRSSSCSRESPSSTSSDSVLEQATTTTTSSSSFPFGGGDYLYLNSNSHQIGEEQYFPSNLFGDSNYYLDMDVLGSYDAL